MTSTGVTHLAVADRVFDGSRRLPSPKKLPARKIPISLPVKSCEEPNVNYITMTITKETCHLPVRVVTSTFPLFIKYMASPLSPCLTTT